MHFDYIGPRAMSDAKNPAPPLPAHIEATIRSIARLHADHHQNVTPLQHAADRIMAFVGSPEFVGVLTALVAGWIGLNSVADMLGYRAIDPPPFPGLELVLSLASVYMVILILATQRREYRLAQLREQLNLELATLSEQKTAKIIQLLEESRRDNPFLRDRVDREADAMAQPADAYSVTEAIKEAHEEAEHIGGRTNDDPGPARRPPTVPSA